MNTYHIYTARMSPAFNGSYALERFERSKAIEIRNGIMFDFYPGLPHIYNNLGRDVIYLDDAPPRCFSAGSNSAFWEKKKAKLHVNILATLLHDGPFLSPRLDTLCHIYSTTQAIS